MKHVIFDIFKPIPLSAFSAAFTPFVRKHLDDKQIQQFLSVYTKQRKLLYQDAEPIQWIQHISVLDAVVSDFNVAKSLNYHFPKMTQMHPVIGQDIRNRVKKFQVVSFAVAAARDEFVNAMHKHFEVNKVQIP